MGDIGRSFDDDSEKFDVVSCMGRSFIYLLTRENYESALCEYFDLLNPGGKIVLQGRECVKGYDDISWSEETKTGLNPFFLSPINCSTRLDKRLRFSFEPFAVSICVPTFIIMICSLLILVSIISCSSV